MHRIIARLLAANSQWAREVQNVEPSFFSESARGQSPKILWFGCSDSRAPESVITASRPGDIFVNRNIANQFHPTDEAALSVLQYAVDTVGVEHIVVVGHTNCGGARACYQAARTSAAAPPPPDAKSTPLTRWLQPLVDLVTRLSIHMLPEDIALPLLVQENVKVQVANISRTETIKNAWSNGKNVHVHGWIYHLETGVIQDLGISAGPVEPISEEESGDAAQVAATVAPS